jgi:hypothetical protein
MVKHSGYGQRFTLLYLGFASLLVIWTEIVMSGLRQIRAERLYAVSDLHVDCDRNRYWMLRLCRENLQDPVLLVAGDISHRLERIRETFAVLTSAFGTVFFALVIMISG